ncbi:hypothetical protein [Paraburkholderia sp. CI3]|uniref:hypothetical protein n=1 Tax=Paraburkholderia sp. CI3 TaxID=2991060 RepID=UPI003D251A11
MIEEFVLEIIRTAEHHGRSKLFLDWSLVSRSFEIELAFLAIRTNRHGVLQVRAANSLEASVTHAKRLGRSVFDPRVQLFAAEVGGRQQALAAHYENRTVCSVRIASNFERLAIGNRQVRATGRAPLQRGWSRRSNPVSDDRASEMSCIGLSREFDADELSDVLLPYVGDYVS